MSENTISDETKAVLGYQAIDCFFGQFGENDLVKEAFIDILLETIYGTESGDDLPLLNETRQEGDQNHSQDGAGEMPCYEIE